MLAQRSPLPRQQQLQDEIDQLKEEFGIMIEVAPRDIQSISISYIVSTIRQYLEFSRSFAEEHNAIADESYNVSLEFPSFSLVIYFGE